MGQNLAQSRFDLTSESVRSIVTRRVSALLSAGVRSSRSARSPASAAFDIAGFGRLGRGHPPPARARSPVPHPTTSNPRDTARDGPAQILHDPYPIKRVVASRASCRVAGSMPTDRGAA